MKKMETPTSASDNYGRMISFLARFGVRGKEAKDILGDKADGRSDAQIIAAVIEWIKNEL